MLARPFAIALRNLLIVTRKVVASASRALLPLVVLRRYSAFACEIFACKSEIFLRSAKALTSINKYNVETIRQIFYMYASGSSFSEIIDEMNRQGRKTAARKNAKK
jgi:hypothetical protein